VGSRVPHCHLLQVNYQFFMLNDYTTYIQGPVQTAKFSFDTVAVISAYFKVWQWCWSAGVVLCFSEQGPQVQRCDALHLPDMT
jgi:hypothetical protein